MFERRELQYTDDSKQRLYQESVIKFAETNILWSYSTIHSLLTETVHYLDIMVLCLYRVMMVPGDGITPIESTR